ncbi:hypothetical protein L211DRAFT_867145 [Terfezia boudieri ATCC MYA-4762]|uniref:Uncharacterized protein n=1 Tax=Terfezia boudieri ATCC MYA-4762 TaxID=1051890 RepID=A0A3N4LVQ4_9PEZI|nr:hypothetical protein L211DRAFT_867145 [Terfezia boudieri ATCC MYA-4762]
MSKCISPVHLPRLAPRPGVSVLAPGLVPAPGLLLAPGLVLAMPRPHAMPRPRHASSSLLASSPRLAWLSPSLALPCLVSPCRSSPCPSTLLQVYLPSAPPSESLALLHVQVHPSSAPSSLLASFPRLASSSLLVSSSPCLAWPGPCLALAWPLDLALLPDLVLPCSPTLPCLAPRL